MMISERSTYMECVAITLTELLLAAYKRVAAIGLSTQAMARRARQRRALAELEDWQLDDLGLTRRAAQAEADKPYWMP